MDGYGLIVVCDFLIFILPICLLFHELGHGILAVFYTKSDVHIYVGLVDEDNKENFRIGRLHFYILMGHEGFAQWEGELNKWQRAVVIAGGAYTLFITVIFIRCVSVFN